MTVRLLAFTQKGMELARRLAAELSGEAARCGEGCTLDAWTADAFANADALVYVGAAGIAVRAVAPYAGNKASDPAVVAVDECGRFAVPLLSGHLGGANRLARRIGAVCGALPVITTATDANGAFAVDEWAVRQGCCVLDVPRIKRVSAKILAGGMAVLRSPWPVAGTPPAGVAADGGALDFELTVHSAARCGSCRASRCWAWAAGGALGSRRWRRPSRHCWRKAGCAPRRFIRCAAST